MDPAPPTQPAARSFRARIGQGWDLAVVSLGIVRRRMRIILFPVVGMVALGSILGGFLGAAAGTSAASIETFALSGLAFLVSAFVLNLVFFFMVILFNAAIAVFALDLLDGKVPTVLATLSRTFRGGRSLFAWAAIAALVSAALRAVQQVVPEIRLELGVVGFAWTFFVALVAPIVLFEGIGPTRAVRRSTTIRRSTWVEGVSGFVSVYAMFFLVGALALPAPVVGFLLGGIPGLALGVLIALLYWIPLFFAGATAKAVLVAVVYRYGTTGNIPPEFRAGAFRKRGAT